MATDIIARGMITEYKSGTNINFAENEDGSVTISASGSISSEDSVARDTINNHKLDKNNPHNVTAEQIGLGNVDNTADLDKPISTAVQQAIDNKADKTIATTSTDGLMSAEDKGKLDAFEITTDGGKLHDKDIATTDDIPDLSAYAKKSDIPTELPANGGTAETISEWGRTPVSDLNTANLGFVAASSDANAAPNTFWSTVLTVGQNANPYKVQMAFPWSSQSDQYMKYRVLDNGVWYDWKEIYTSGNKPYITGSATVAANSSVCVSNHGFTPCAVVWWDGNSSGVAVSFNETQFNINIASTDARTVNYLIFK